MTTRCLKKDALVGIIYGPFYIIDNLQIIPFTHLIISRRLSAVKYTHPPKLQPFPLAINHILAPHHESL